MLVYPRDFARSSSWTTHILIKYVCPVDLDSERLHGPVQQQRRALAERVHIPSQMVLMCPCFINRLHSSNHQEILFTKLCIGGTMFGDRKFRIKSSFPIYKRELISPIPCGSRSRVSLWDNCPCDGHHAKWGFLVNEATTSMQQSFCRPS